MDAAAGEGHLDVVKWLHANGSERCTDQAMYWAAEHGHLDVVKWLYVHRPDSHTPFAIDGAVRSGHLRIVCWLQPQFPEYKIGSSLKAYESLVGVDGSWDSGKTFEMLLYLHVRYRLVFTPQFLERLRKDLSRDGHGRDYPHLLGNVENWLDDHYPSK